MHILRGEAGTIGFNDEATNLAIVFIALCPNDCDVGNGSRGDPHLFAIQDVFVTSARSTGFHATGVGSESRFSKSEATDFFALREERQPFVLLLVAAERINGIHHQRRLHADERSHSAVAALQLLHYQSVFNIGHARTSIALKAGTEKSQVTEGLNQFARKTSFSVALLDDRDKIFLNEFPRIIADQPLVVGQQRVEIDEVHTFEFDCRHITLLSGISTSGQTFKGNRKEEVGGRKRQLCCEAHRTRSSDCLLRILINLYSI